MPSHQRSLLTRYTSNEQCHCISRLKLGNAQLFFKGGFNYFENVEFKYLQIATEGLAAVLPEPSELS